ncbi:hypothetical protein J4450_03425 [Candidatus Micrarchaeota archaeon]|nr:hypothetical protein [Candidatus Micrarchaeota archaeon]
MEYVQISKEEYEKLLKYRDIVNNIEEDIHEELNVKPITDKRAIEKLKRLDKEVKEGKRKTFSKEEFLAEFGK